MKWLKKGNLLGALAAVGLVWLLVALFLDPFLKRALISAGQAAAGAKVEIESVRTRLLKGSFVVSGVAVANKNEPMKNLVELAKAELRFSPSAALRAKAVVDDASIAGLRFGTPRKTSGALARAEPSRFKKMIAEQLAPVKTETLGQLGKTKKAAAEIDPKKLSSRAALDQAQQKLDALAARAKERAGVEKIEAQVKDLEVEVAGLKGGGSSPAEIARKTAGAQRAREKGKALLDDVRAAKDAARRDVAEVRSALARADELRKKDLAGLMAEAGLPSLDAESLTRRLIGPIAAQKLSTALYWVNWARARQAKSQKEKAKSPPPTPKGVNVEFPVKNALPAFLLRRAALDGRVDDLFQGQALDLKGELAGVTSNPPLYGKPATLQLAGSNAGVSMRLDGRMDQTREDGPTELRLHYAGLPLAGTRLGDDELSATLGSGVGRIDGALKIAGDAWGGRFVLEAEGVSLEPALTGLDARAARVVSSALRGVKRFTATVGVEGAGDDLRLRVTSDLGRVLADGMKAAVSGELLAQRRELEKKLDAALGPRAKELQARAGALQDALLAPLDKQQAALEEQLRKAVAGATGTRGLERALPKDLKKIFR